MYKSEKQRLVSKREQILNVLRSAGSKGVTNAELSVTALRYGGSLGELYKLGYEIETESLGDGLYKYTLVSEPETLVKREKAIDLLLKEVEKQGMVSKNDLLAILENKNIAVKYKANTYKS
ncbi:hypothetical protein PQE66_gp136 [Bacillus phage PBC2]|uniref:Uncharacterized protein n=1 Tax=Bacillus phage PBC2 TaxID=1675029 RepID=A0A218KC39_9CAUD|nr:hypothetical protein PQE66_gp136 [Bacillus phage PBC2]AKQ08451.1 hypothetical protein PBC2_136 [Bacillus phage PBC2]